MDLILQKESQNSEMVIWVKGVLDISTTTFLEDSLEELDNIDKLIIDLTGLEFIDSTGIGSILNAIFLSQEKNFKLHLRGINEINRSVFETVGLFQILESVQGEVI